MGKRDPSLPSRTAHPRRAPRPGLQITHPRSTYPRRGARARDQRQGPQEALCRTPRDLRPAHRHLPRGRPAGRPLFQRAALSGQARARPKEPAHQTAFYERIKRYGALTGLSLELQDLHAPCPAHHRRHQRAPPQPRYRRCLSGSGMRIFPPSGSTIEGRVGRKTVRHFASSTDLLILGVLGLDSAVNTR